VEIVENGEALHVGEGILERRHRLSDQFLLFPLRVDLQGTAYDFASLGRAEIGLPLLQPFEDDVDLLFGQFVIRRVGDHEKKKRKLVHQSPVFTSTLNGGGGFFE